MQLREANDMNVPVNLTITYNTEAGQWELEADNYMPRKSRIESGAYSEVANVREVLELLVLTHVVPLYATALLSLTTKHELVYWEVSDATE